LESLSIYDDEKQEFLSKKQEKRKAPQFCLKAAHVLWAAANAAILAPRYALERGLFIEMKKRWLEIIYRKRKRARTIKDSRSFV
jgi:hypothetical protein